MEPIYVTGHRNPDTDSIVSAMAYAALRNALGDREFVPARLGHISDETRLVLDRRGHRQPGLGGTADQQSKIHPRYPRDERKRRAVRHALTQRDRKL